MKQAFEVLKLSAIAIGMAITISCNTILVSLFSFTTGSQLLLAIAIAGACMAVIVLCFSELASKFPGAIGIRAFTKVAFGNQFSLAVTLFYVVMVALIGGLEVYLCHLLLQQLLPPVFGLTILVALILFVVVVNLKGYELSLQLQIFMTLSVAGMMLVLSGMALQGDGIADSIRNSGGITSTLKQAESDDLFNAIPRALFLFIGIEWAIMHVSKHQVFKRILPISLLTGVVVIAALYSNFAAALAHQFEIQTLQGDLLPHLSLAQVMQSESAKFLVIVISLLAVLSSFNVGLSGAARILYSLARERELPHWFAQLHGDKFIPRNAMFLVVIAVLLIAPLMSVPAISSCLGQLLSFHLALIYACVLFAWLQMRRRKDSRGVKQWVHPSIVWPIALFLLVISVGVLFEPGGDVMRWIVLSEVAALGGICLYLFRLKIIKIEG